MAKLGMSYTDPKGHIRQRPEVSIEGDAKASYLRCLKDLRLSDAVTPGHVKQGSTLGVTAEFIDGWRKS